MQTTRTQESVPPGSRLAYYRQLADLTRVFWEYYKLDLAAREHTGDDYVVAIGGSALQAKIEGNFQNSGKPQEVITDFTQEIGADMISSLHRFLQFSSLPGRDYQVPAEQRRFVQSDFTRELVTSANTAVVSMSKVDILFNGAQLQNLEEILKRGIGAGVSLTAQVIAISYSVNSLKVPAAVLMVSKLDRSQLLHAGAHLGIKVPSREFPTTDYALIDPTGHYGINKTLLVDVLGYPGELGCPAAMKPSEECRKYLTTFGVSHVGTAMVVQLAERMARLFDDRIMSWVRSLDPEKKTRMIHQKDLLFLEGGFLNSPQASMRISCPHYTKAK